SQERVDERGLAMVDVRHERDVAELRGHVLWGVQAGRDERAAGKESVVEIVGVVVVVVIVLVERDAVLFGERCVLVVLSTLAVTIATEAQIERTGTCLLELARFFEAAVTTLLHDRAPEPRELT